MYSFDAMYEAEAYRQDKLNDVSKYRQQSKPVTRKGPVANLTGLLAAAVLASWYKPLN